MISSSVSLAAFIAAAGVLTITPGLDTALVLRAAVTGNSRAAPLAGLGIAVGCFCWAVLVAVSLGALLTASQLAYTVLRWVGAVHALPGLVWFSCLIVATRPLSRLMRRPETARTCDRVTGAIFVAFGVGLALSARRP